MDRQLSQPVVLMSRQSSTMAGAAADSDGSSNWLVDNNPQQHPKSENETEDTTTDTAAPITTTETDADDTSKEQSHLKEVKKTFTEEIRRLEAEAAADLTTRSVAFVRRRQAATKNTDESTNQSVEGSVVLTGAAGYLGAAVLEQLLLPFHQVDQNCNYTKILCVVRQKPFSTNVNEDRVWTSFCKILGCHPDTMRLEGTETRQQVQRAAYCLEMRRVYKKHVQVVHGDVQLPYFGLEDESRYQSTFLQCPILAIYHCAAEVKHWDLHVDSLRQLVPTNVTGCVHIAQLAMDAAEQNPRYTIPPIVHVSTSSVCKGQCVTAVDEEQETWVQLSDIPDITLQHFDAYSASKLMGENILRRWHMLMRKQEELQECDARGDTSSLSLFIVRPPLLTWHSESGAANNEDWLNRLVDTVLALRLVPTAPGLLERTPFTPVDRCAATMVRLVTDRNLNKAEDDTTFPGLKVVYPFAIRDDTGALEATDAATLSMTSVLRVVQQVVNQSLHNSKAGDVYAEKQEMFVAEGGKENLLPIRSIPAYAWRVALTSIAISYPLPHHPLLAKGLLETQRAAGVRPVQPLNTTTTSLVKMEQLPDSDDWVGPLTLYLRRVLAA